MLPQQTSVPPPVQHQQQSPSLHHQSPHQMYHPPSPPQQTYHPPPPAQQSYHQPPPPPPTQDLYHPPPPAQQMYHQSPPPASHEMYNQPPPASQQMYHPPPPSSAPRQIYHQPPPPPSSQDMYHQPPPPQQMYHHSPPPPQQMYHQPPQPQRTLDLDEMPSVVQVTEEEIERCQTWTSTVPASLPPCAAALEAVKPNLEDNGCARPCHMRSTIYRVPVNKELLQSSGLEFAVVTNPFDLAETTGMYVPQSTSPIVRCNRCKSYMNPFMDFIDGGRKFQCCICTHVNPVPDEYFSQLDHLSKRVDRMQRPELYLGSYEFKVTSEYYRNQLEGIRRPHIVFAIELTANSKQLVQNIATYLPKVIKESLPADFAYTSSLCPLVAFVTYNSKIQLYDVNNGGHAYIISDMSAVSSLASTSKFLIDPNQNFEAIEKFLETLPSLCTEIDLETQTIFGPVIEAAFKSCQVDTSNWYNQENGDNPKGSSKQTQQKEIIPTGKIYVFQASLPTYGPENTPGRLSLKRNLEELRKYIGTEKEKDVLSPEGKYYNQLAQKCVSDYGSGIELFLFPQNPRSYLNFATLSELACLTGTGVVNKYYIYESPENFVFDLECSLKSTMAFDASMKVRSSTGISPSRYLGNFNSSAGSNIEMACVNANSNLITFFKYDDNLQENEMVIIQFAIIYTSLWGERRVRVHNLALGTCDLLGDLFKMSCCDTIVNVLVRDVVEGLRSGTICPKAAKERMTSSVINILVSYRKNCAVNPLVTSQLILPEVLKLLPVYLCGALKCDAIDGGPEMFPDDKVLAQVALLGATVAQSQNIIYPRMYVIEASSANDESETFGLHAKLTRCYGLALNDQNELGLQFLEDVFGSHKDFPELDWSMRQKESNSTKFLEQFLKQLYETKRKSLNIIIVRQDRDKRETIFRLFLYEDVKKLRSTPKGSDSFKLDNASYVEVLLDLHQVIRTKIQQ